MLEGGLHLRSGLQVVQGCYKYNATKHANYATLTRSGAGVLLLLLFLRNLHLY